MDSYRLLVFEAVATSGSFSRAARTLHLSQPSVSRHVLTLERQLGLRLLHRTRAGTRLTPAGAALLERASSVRAELAAADAVAEAFRGGSEGVLRVASFPSAAATLAAPALGRLAERHPALVLSLNERARRQALVELRSGEIDVALVFGGEGGARDLGGLGDTTVKVDPLFAALPRHHPLASGRALRLSRLAKFAWIVGTDDTAPGLIEEACIAAGFSPRIVARADDQPTIQALVAANIGVTLIPELAANRVRRDVALVPLNPQLSRRVSAITLGAKPLAAPTQSFLAELEQVAAEYRGLASARSGATA